MLNIKRYKIQTWVAAVTMLLGFSACKKDGNPNNLPSVSPADYEGTVDGFRSSDEVFSANQVAYWSFDDTKNEQKSGAAPSLSVNDAFMTGGVRGKALKLTAGYLKYGNQFNAFKFDSLKSFTVSMWVQALNNGTRKTQIFQLARPGMTTGNIDFVLETDLNPASNTDYVRIHAWFATLVGRQDNVNAFGAQNLSPKFGATKWTHLLLTYDRATGIFNIWGDGVKIGNYPNRGTAANNLFNNYEPNEIIFGGNASVIPGPDATYAAMTGSIDEVRVYNRPLPDAFILALYKLGLAGK